VSRDFPRLLPGGSYTAPARSPEPRLSWRRYRGGVGNWPVTWLFAHLPLYVVAEVVRLDLRIQDLCVFILVLISRATDFVEAPS